MAGLSYTADQLREGKRLLRELLPAARVRAKSEAMEATGLSALGRAQLQHITEARLHALVIYAGPLGGWHADLLLRHMPIGVPTILGTPSHRPKHTREEALAAGERLLTMALVQAAKPKQAEVPPAFLLYGAAITLMPELLERLRDTFPDLFECDPAEYLARLQKVVGDSFEPEAFNALPDLEKVKVLLPVHLLVLRGVFAYPERYYASPSGHRESAAGHA